MGPTFDDALLFLGSIVVILLVALWIVLRLGMFSASPIMARETCWMEPMFDNDLTTLCFIIGAMCLAALLALASFL
jgi:hypothetical protein